jgi:hypothetical protein
MIPSFNFVCSVEINSHPTLKIGMAEDDDVDAMLRELDNVIDNGSTKAIKG